MPYPVISGAIVEMSYRYKLNGQQCINVFHFKTDGPITDGATVLNNFLTDFATNWGSAFNSLQTSEATECTARGQFVYPTRYIYQEQTVATGVGGLAPPTVSVGTSLVLRKLSDVASRSSRGRVYLGGCQSASLSIGTWNSGFVTIALTSWGPLAVASLADMTEGRFANHVIWSYTDPANTDEVTVGTVDRYARYQRRREVGRGI